jgi:hypothetical protein
VLQVSAMKKEKACLAVMHIKGNILLLEIFVKNKTIDHSLIIETFLLIAITH